MSNAVSSIAPAVVNTDLLINSFKSNQNLSSLSDPPSPLKNSCVINTPTSLSTSTSNSEVNSTEEQLNLSMTSNNTNTTSNDGDCQYIANNSVSNNPANQTVSSAINVSNIKPQVNTNSKSSYYHPNQPQHFIVNQHSPMNLNHYNISQSNPQLNGAGIQYIQINSNSNSTSLTSASPISSSLTSSPSTINSSIQYINHQQQSHLNKHYPSGASGVIHSIQSPAHFQYQLPQHHLPQHQQFQQLQQFHSQFQTNYKDTRWLTLEVCREFQRNKCNRNETECKFAHPPSHVEIINGKVIACYDSLKGKCTRKEPPCKYLHPPQHLKDQLLQNGKNNLVLRQVALAMMQQQQTNVQTNPETTAALLAAANRTTPQFATFTATSSTNPNQNSAAPANQFIINGGIPGYQPIQLANGQPHLLQMLSNGYSNQNLITHNLHMQQQNIYANDPNSTLLHSSTISPPILSNANNILPPQQRTDRLQICKEFQKKTCEKTASECAFAHPPSHCPLDQGNTLVIVCVDFIKGKCSRETCKYFHPPEHLVAQLKKQKLANNALAAAAYASNNLGQNHFSPLNITASTGSINQMNSYNPFRLNRQSFDPTNSLQYVQVADQHQQYQLQQQRQHYISASQLLSSRINALNNNASLRAASFLDNSSSLYNANNNQMQQISAVLASSTTSIPATTGNHSQHDMNDVTGTIVTLENGQTYQLPQYHMGATIFQRAEDMNSQIDSKTAKSASASSATANNVVDHMPGKKRQHEGIEQDFNPMSSGNIYSASNISVKRTALTDTKTGMPIFQPLCQSLNQLGPQTTGVGISHLHPSHTQQQIALSQQLAALNNYPTYNFSQLQYAPVPTTFPLNYNGQPTNIPRL